jgi:integrase
MGLCVTLTDYCMLLLMFRHGLRVSELCSIKLSDINVDTKEFHVNRLKGSGGGPHELYNGERPAIKAWLVDESSGRMRHALCQRAAQTIITLYGVADDWPGRNSGWSGAP